jgi:hypothetical protein
LHVDRRMPAYGRFSTPWDSSCTIWARLPQDLTRVARLGCSAWTDWGEAFVAHCLRRLVPALEVTEQGPVRVAHAAARVPALADLYAHFRRHWRGGPLCKAHDRLRCRVREPEGRAPKPSGAVVDSQSVRTAGSGGPARGYNSAKRLKGRKRHLLVDTLGLVMLASVHAADLHDREGGGMLVAAEPA